MKIEKKQKLSKEWFIKLQNIICNNVEQMEKERDQKGSRDWTMKALITKHKKLKLKVKDELAHLE